MMETALVFGRTNAGKFPAARQMVLSVPLLCDGKTVDCDLAYRARSRLLVAVFRLACPEDQVIFSRLRFWAARLGGRAVSLSALAERPRTIYHRLLARCELHRRGIEPGHLGEALARVATAVGAAPEKAPPSRPALVLNGSHHGWDGAVYEPEARRLFLPSPLSPPSGDELRLQVRGSQGGALEAQARVVQVFAPGQRGSGSPAGFALQLASAAPDLVEALAVLAPPRPGPRRMAPRYPVEAPVVVRPRAAERQPVARLEYGSERELADDYVSNLSQGGAFIRSSRPWPVGTELALEMRLLGGTLLRAPATVVRVDAAGMGVRFQLDEAGEEQLGEVIARISTRQRRALVVDDDALARRMIADALAERGFEVFAASDGVTGLEVLTDELLALDMVVADLRMPAMDGEAFLKTVRGVGGERDLTVVMVSGSLDPGVEARLHGEGADAVLDKSLGAELIAQASDAALERKRLENAG
jgi:CheY-like chemotaxis protein